MNRSLPIAGGFTLVEATIVLVIVGLLISGIIWGRELLVHGRSKAVTLELNEIAAALQAYQDRYQAVPGDDSGAQVRWGWTAVPAAVPSTPGDRRVDGAYNAPSATPEPESRLFWWHLRQAGFLTGAADPAFPAVAAQQPTNAVGGLIGVTTGVGAASVGLSGLIVCTANVPDKIASSVDLRLDDGKSADGAVRAQRQTVPNENLGTAAPGYVEDGSQYLLCRSLS